MDMGGLDNLIANTAYLQARKTDSDSRELQRRRRGSFALPLVAVLHYYGGIIFHFMDIPCHVSFHLLVDTWVASTLWLLCAVLECSSISLRTCLSVSWVYALEENPGHAAILCLTFPGISKLLPTFYSPTPIVHCSRVTISSRPATACHFLLFFFFLSPLSSATGFTSSPPLLSQVCAVQVRNTGKMYACKKLDKKRLKKKGGEKMALLEKEILEKVNSPFIVSLAYAFESKTHLCLVMSLMNGGDLKFHIYNVGTRGLAMSRVIFYTAQMTCGVLHLHGLGIVYRDLKPENVLLDDLGNCRLSDLGLAVEVQDDKPITQRAGTNGYMAPEILMDKASYSYPVDWFAMGCSIYEMVAGRTPFKDFKEKVSKEDLKERTMKDEVAFHHENFTEETKDICRLFLAKKPEQRLGSREKADDPRKHPFFQTVNFPRLEAGLVEPPFVPDPSVVYAKDVDEIDDFSEVRGVEFDDKDKQFFQRFSTGAVPVAWQEEIIETGLFEELNDPNRPSGDGKGDSSKSGVCLLL
uniref:G protein-coupled receptor kinase n=1 Tax=Spermophilus dauricus TaxID=99837 RepID=A0A8C9PER3_SPEDA